MKEYFIFTLNNIFNTYFIILDTYEVNKSKTLDEKFIILSGLNNISLSNKIDECITIDDEINLLYKVFACTRKKIRYDIVRVTLEAKKEYIQIRLNDTEIRFYYAGDNLEPTMVTLNHAMITTFTGATFELIATIYPEDVIYNSLTWTSSNEEIATVDQNGKVCILSAGNCAITVRTSNNKYAICQITSMVDIASVENDIRSLKNDILLINGKQQEFADLLDSIDAKVIGNIEIVNNMRAEIDEIKNKLTEFEIYESEENINIKTNNIKIYG